MADERMVGCRFFQLELDFSNSVLLKSVHLAKVLRWYLLLVPT